MNKTKLFIENFVVYGIGGVINKIIPLIMLPIITRLMPDTFYFGLNDLSHTLINFAQAIAIMGMYDAMYRTFFEKEDTQFEERVCSTALTFTACMSVLVFILLLLFRKPLSQFVFGDSQYINLLFLSAISVLIGATNSIVAAPTRMQNYKKIYLVVSLTSSVVAYAISIPLLLNGYYIIALPLSSIIAALSTEIVYFILNKKWFRLGLFDKTLLKQMLSIAIPLVPNFLIYWIFNSSDRLMIAKILGNNYAGVYAIGAKLGQCSQLIYTAFAGGWQYFAFSTMGEKNQVESNSKIFEYLGIISFAATAFIMALSRPIYQIFFEGDYVKGYVVSGYLFMAPLLQMLFQVAANQFIVIKKTWPNAIILFGGAITNVALNLILIPRIGIEGAAIATLIGYILTDIICCSVLVRMHLMVISIRFFISSGLTFIYILLWRLFFRENWLIGTLLSMALCLSLFAMYRNDLSLLWSNLQKKGRDTK
mgnify:CR=1 FL=1